MGKMYRKLAPCGGDGGDEWDDDVYEGIRKVYVGQALTRITYLKFEYVKEDGEIVTREYGTIGFHSEEFALDPDEHIIAVEGRCHRLDVKEMITALVFKTSKGKISPLFGPKKLLSGFAGTEFVFYDGGNKIVGFHGRSGNALDALGVYFVHNSPTTSSSLYKLGAQGGTKGSVRDDGPYDGVKTLRIGQDNCRITYLEFEYEKDKESETRHHGVKGETPSEFVLEWPDEYIKSVEATYQKPSLFRNTIITSIKLETSKGRTSFLVMSWVKSFEQKDRRLVGFHGNEGDAIDALGAYFAPIGSF